MEVTVTPEMSPPHLPRKVLSTPSMVQLMEQACLLGVAPYLDEGETTVGVHICVSHVAAAAAGEMVTIGWKLAEVGKRRLHFEVRASAAIAWWVRARTTGPSSTPAASPADHVV